MASIALGIALAALAVVLAALRHEQTLAAMALGVLAALICCVGARELRRR